MCNYKKRIAVIGLKGLPAYGGAAFVGESIIDKLKDRYDFTVYSMSSHTNKSTGMCNNYYQIVFRTIPFKKLGTIYYYIISTIHSLLFNHYDLVHLHHRDASFILPLLRLRYKVVLTTHGFVLTEKWKKFNHLFGLQDRLFLRFANTITCVSKKDLSIAKNYHKKDRVIHIPNGIDVPRRNYMLRKKGEYILFAAGRIVPSKGCHILLQSLSNINYSGKINIVGDYTQMNNYYQILKSFSTSLQVEFTGLIKNKELLYDNISKAFLFVYPSSIESMSMMLLEVASLGIPIICSDIQENKDIFEDNEVLFFKTDNIQDLSDKIQWALSNFREMLLKSDNAINKLIQKYNWPIISKEYGKIYELLLE